MHGRISEKSTRGSGRSWKPVTLRIRRYKQRGHKHIYVSTLNTKLQNVYRCSMSRCSAHYLFSLKYLYYTFIDVLMRTSTKLAGLALLIVFLIIGTQFAHASNWEQYPVELRQKIAAVSGNIETAQLLSSNISTNPAIAERAILEVDSFGAKNSLIVCGDILCKDGDHRIYITPWVYNGQLINTP